MKSLNLSILIVALTLLAFGGITLVPRASSQSTTSESPKSRLGVKGVMGFIITSVDPDSTVENAGLKSGDIVLDIGGDQISGIEQFQKKIWTSTPGTVLEITYLRFNSSTGQADQRKTSVKTIPFTTSNVSVKMQPVAAKTFASNASL